MKTINSILFTGLLVLSVNVKSQTLQSFTTSEHSYAEASKGISNTNSVVIANPMFGGNHKIVVYEFLNQVRVLVIDQADVVIQDFLIPDALDPDVAIDHTGKYVMVTYQQKSTGSIIYQSYQNTNTGPGSPIYANLVTLNLGLGSEPNIAYGERGILTWKNPSNLYYAQAFMPGSMVSTAQIVAGGGSNQNYSSDCEFLKVNTLSITEQPEFAFTYITSSGDLVVQQFDFNALYGMNSILVTNSYVDIYTGAVMKSPYISANHHSNTSSERAYAIVYEYGDDIKILSHNSSFTSSIVTSGIWSVAKNSDPVCAFNQNEITVAWVCDYTNISNFVSYLGTPNSFYKDVLYTTFNHLANDYNTSGPLISGPMNFGELNKGQQTSLQPRNLNPTISTPHTYIYPYSNYEFVGYTDHIYNDRFIYKNRNSSTLYRMNSEEAEINNLELYKEWEGYAVKCETPISYELSNIQGKLIDKVTGLNNEFNIDLSSYSEGIYIVKVKTKTKEYVRKLIR